MYTLAEKLDIVKQAYDDNGSTAVKATAKKYCIQPQQIRCWKKHFQCVHREINTKSGNEMTKVIRRTHTNKKSRFVGGGRKDGFSAELIEQVKQYYNHRRSLSLSVSIQQLKVEAMRIDPVSCSTLSHNALRKRIARLLDRWDVSFRRGTHVAQNTRFDDMIITDFQKHIVDYCKILGVKPENIYNADQTNVPFGLVSNSTYADRGSKTVSIKGVKSSSRCTVMLCCSLTAGKLPPYIVFRGSSNRTGSIYRELISKEGYPTTVSCTVQEKGWFNEEIMLSWIENVWKKYASKPNEKSLILLDEFQVHLTTKVKDAFFECNTAVEYIPPGYTSKLQVCDVGINKPFKDHLRREYDIWMMENLDDRRPKRQDVARWIDTSWKSISSNTITNTWRRCMAFKPSIVNSLPPIEYNQLEQDHIEEEDDFLEFDQDPFHSVGPIPENRFH
jgi:DDE superfamily endonuclease